MSMKKALFSQRLLAFILDMFIASILVSIVTAFIPVSDGVTKLYDEQTEILEKYTSQEVGMEDYVNQFVDVNYEISRQTAVISIISIVISLLYYVVYPFYNKGQSLGKKLLKIRIIKQNQKELTMNDLLFRAMIINSIFANIVSVCLILFLNKSLYMTSSNVVVAIQYVILLVSLFLIAFTKKRLGLHDMLLKTEVVVDEKIKEEEKEVCVS